MSSIAYIILGSCLGSVISVFAMIACIVVDDKAAKEKADEAMAEACTEAYKAGVIAGSRWKEAEKAMIEQAVKELRAEVEELEAVNELKK